MTQSLLCISASCVVFSSSFFLFFFFSSDREKKAVLAKLLPSAHTATAMYCTMYAAYIRNDRCCHMSGLKPRLAELKIITTNIFILRIRVCPLDCVVLGAVKQPVYRHRTDAEK